MKNIEQTFPTGINILQKYAPDVPSSMALESLTAAFQNAYLRVANVIGETFLDAAIDSADLQQYAQGALANYTVYEQSPFIFKGRDKNYRYQEIEMKDKYISNAWSFINALIGAFDRQDSQEWKTGECYASRQNLVFSNQNDFDNYYAIDKSAYFFSKIVFLIREESLKFIPKRITITDLSTKTGLREALKYLIAYRVIARAVMQFEVSELPKSLRHDINHEYTKYANAGDYKQRLFDYLNDKTNDYLDNVEIEFQKAHKTFAEGDINNPNSESKKYYFMR
ncbi:MAG: hypothetical protein LBK94_06710 [Prevotellaceae bacterium]|jgi:hypothetical protein|nr:hypothetical protein [Prevotellaceae bacterium]